MIGAIRALVVTAMTVASAGAANAQSTAAAVRPEEDAVRMLIDTGMERSATFRDLISRLNATDLVVYVRFAQCAGRVPACLLWASPASGQRRLLIKIDRFAASPNSLISLLAHELQHACEVAGAPDVVDVPSFEKAFAERGRKGAHGYETREAGDVGRRVLTELTQPRAAVRR
jgi:hypothetical protein